MIDDAQVFNDKLREWEDFSNYHRPHGGLDGQTPYERLKQRTQTPAVTAQRQLHTRVGTRDLLEEGQELLVAVAGSALVGDAPVATSKAADSVVVPCRR